MNGDKMIKEQLEYISKEVYKIRIFFYVEWDFSIDFTNEFNPIHYCEGAEDYTVFIEAINRAYIDVRLYSIYVSACNEYDDEYDTFINFIAEINKYKKMETR